jgi:hypothetical protein
MSYLLVQRDFSCTKHHFSLRYQYQIASDLFSRFSFSVLQVRETDIPSLVLVHELNISGRKREDEEGGEWMRFVI